MADRKLSSGFDAAATADAMVKGNGKAPWVQAGMTEDEWRRGKAQNAAELATEAARHSHPTVDDVGIKRR